MARLPLYSILLISPPSLLIKNRKRNIIRKNKIGKTLLWQLGIMTLRMVKKKKATRSVKIV